MKNIETSEELSNVKQGVFLFSAAWCGPCKTVTPILESISNQTEFKDIEFMKIDVDKFGDLATSFGIRNIPSILFIKNDQVEDKLLGAQGEDKLIERINSVFSSMEGETNNE